MGLYVAVLDACVLYPFSLRDTLLRAAENELYSPRWTDRILEEATCNLVGNGRVSAQQARRLTSVISDTFPEADVTGYGAFEELMLNHLKDRHVLAAAVVANADVIVTENLRDFPEYALEPYGIKARSSDGFLCELYEGSPDIVVGLIREQADDLRNPTQTVQQVIESLRRIAPGFAALLIGAIASDQYR